MTAKKRMSWPWIMPWIRSGPGIGSVILCLVSGFEFNIVFEPWSFVEKEKDENQRRDGVGEEWRD